MIDKARKPTNWRASAKLDDTHSRATVVYNACYQVFNRNANAFSPNAIVDARLRRRRHEMIFFWNISETIRASLALDSLYISAGNELTSCFRTAEIRINVFILDQIRVAISR